MEGRTDLPPGHPWAGQAGGTEQRGQATCLRPHSRKSWCQDTEWVLPGHRAPVTILLEQLEREVALESRVLSLVLLSGG